MRISLMRVETTPALVEKYDRLNCDGLMLVRMIRALEQRSRRSRPLHSWLRMLFGKLLGK